ncbi:MAG: DUF6476 family protein [Amylibacter sp.]|jgi:hypothetical protein
MNELSDDIPEPGNLRLLRRLVTTLIVVMILGFLTLIAMLVMRLAPSAPELPLPSSITLPDGSKAETFTQGPDWFAVVTTDSRILIYDRVTGELRQMMEIEK